MTNLEFIKSNKPEKEMSYEYLLAQSLISQHVEEQIDYDWEENPYTSGYEVFYTTSDGQEFSEYAYDEAIEHEIWWLHQKHFSADDHVYCTNCVHFSPSESKSGHITVCSLEHRCCSLNFEDSMPYKDRPYYEECEEKRND